MSDKAKQNKQDTPEIEQRGESEDRGENAGEKELL